MVTIPLLLFASADLDDLLTGLSQSLTTTTANIVISGAILLAAIGFYLFGFMPTQRRLKRQLREANAELAKFKDEKAFSASYEAFNSWAREYPIIGEAWQEFSETLLIPKPTDDFQLIRNSVPPESSFNDATIIEPHLNLRLFSAFPNFLTGAGILGTFIGLVAGIFVAKEGLTLTRVEDVKNALQGLLSGASLAFMTSIAGLVGSILFSSAEKYALHKLQNSVAFWNAQLNRCLLRVTPELLAHDQLTETKKQVVQLERFNTDFAVTMAESLNQRLSESFGPTLEKLLETLEASTRSRADVQHKALEDLVRQFKEALTGTAGSEMSSMKSAFEELNRGLKDTVNRVMEGQNNLVVLTEAMTSGIGKAVEENIRNFQQAVSDGVGKIISRLEEAGGTTANKISTSGASAAESLNYASSKLTDSINGLDGIVKSTEAMMQHHQSSIMDLQKLLTVMKSTASSISAGMVPINDSVRQLQDTSKSLASGIERLGVSSEALRKSASDIADAQEKTGQAWLLYEKRFAGVDLSLRKAFEQLTEAQATQIEQMHKFLLEVDKKIGDSLENLSGIAKELFDAVESLGDTFGRVTGGPTV